MIGQTFGRWVVVAEAESTFRNRPPRKPLKIRNYLCRCTCGTERVVAMSRLKNGRSTSCGCLRAELVSRKGEESPNWKGGVSRWLRPDGYVSLLFSDTKRRVVEHRYVMEQHLGRRLLSSERVHHRNGERADNRIENLELWVTSHPAGQHVNDVRAWAQEILRLYPNDMD